MKNILIRRYARTNNTRKRFLLTQRLTFSTALSSYAETGSESRRRPMSADSCEALEYLDSFSLRHRFQTDRPGRFADFGYVFHKELENCAEGIDVRALVELADLATCLFGRHVIAGADH